MSIGLTEITDYLFCPLYFYLKHRDPVPGLQANSMSTTDLPGQAISQALQVYAGGKFPDMNFRQIVQAVWATWMNQKNVEKDAMTMILALSLIHI